MSEYNRENHHDEHHDDISRLQQQLAEQDARGLRLAGENERLRERLDYVANRPTSKVIEDLSQENERLRAENEVLLRENTVLREANDSGRAEVERLRADKEKLVWFYKMVRSGGPDMSDLDDLVVREADEVVRNALTEEKE